jgi:hypothetical protein
MGLLARRSATSNFILISRPPTRPFGETIMTCSSIKLLTAAAAAVAGGLLLADIPQAQARSAGATSATAKAADGYRPRPVIRDHRKSPQQPWTLPPHYHRHDRR